MDAPRLGDDDSRKTLRIDDLARLTGLSARNIRAYQERGLLPAPEVRARSGFYGPEHIARLELIQTLRDEGLKLDGIKRLLDASQSRTADLMRIKRAAEAVDQVETPVIASVEELRERLAIADDDAAARFFATSQRLGLLTVLDDGRCRVPSPSLIDAAETVVRSGVDLEHALTLVERVAGYSTEIARGFVEAFVDDVWRRFADAGMPEDALARMAEAMESTRTASTNVVLAVFRLKMAAEVESAFAGIVRETAESA